MKKLPPLFILLCLCSSLFSSNFKKAKFDSTYVKLKSSREFVELKEYFFNVLEEKSLSERDLLYVTIQYARFCKDLGQYDISVDNLDRAHFELNAFKHKDLLQKIYQIKACTYFDSDHTQERKDSAQYYAKLLLIDNSLLHESEMEHIYNIVAHYLYLEGEYEKVEGLIDQSLKIQKEYEPCNMALSYLKKMRLFNKTNDSAALNNAYQSAVNNIDSCGIIDYKYLIYFNMYLIQKEQGNYAEALNKFEIATSVRDSLDEKEQRIQINKLDKKYESELKDEKIKTFDIKLNLVYAAVAVLVILCVSILIIYRRKRKFSLILLDKNQLIENTLEEKQLLLKEVHHRVKNNFQIISSLLELQSKGIEDEKAKELAQEGKNRIKSMSLIHQRLYQNDDLLIYFNEYIESLVREISVMYGAESKAKINISVSNLAFDIDTAIPLGLIVNELITNAMKYGRATKGSEIDVSIHKQNEEGDFELTVKDNGEGMPADFDISKAKSLGLRLIKSLSKQLHGKASYSNESGAVFKVGFKNSSARALVR